MAAELGAEGVYDARAPAAEAVRGVLGRGVDRVIVCTGARAAVLDALAAVDRGGTVVFFAPMGPEDELPVPFNRVFWHHEATLVSSYGAAPRDLAEALELIASGRLDVDRLVTHRLPLGQIGRGFAMMLEAKGSLKIVIDPRLNE